MPDQQPLNLTSAIALVTGGSNGIGAAVVSHLNTAGATVVIVDLASTESSAQTVIASLPQPSNALFLAADVADWLQLRAVFGEVRRRFGGRLHLVVACAGTMEHHSILEDRFDVDGELEEPSEAYRTIDVNLKGSLNTLKLALYALKSSPTSTSTSSPRSITLIASTAGYFDGAGTLAYTASKHGVIGLLRASQTEARKHKIRVNAVAPFFTSTHLTSGIADAWVSAGLEVNSPQAVARVIVETAVDPLKEGVGVLVAGRYIRELEHTRMGLLSSWVGDEVSQFMGRAGAFFERIGGYVLPGPR
ncbi:hypothetical protein BJY01DRAFT_256405 [Aspergillus pseudoustus]|uniref:NAD(P)-binding protein n=1 Tax=Aspergillus pseudoustus TaxID=1810923 RepID=A0ABR4IB09_9EURO